MNWLDIIILIPLCWFGFTGLKNGLIRELASILALVLGVWVTVKFSNLVASWIGDSQLIRIIAFFLTFLAVLVLVHFAGKLVENIVKLVVPSFLNHLFGLIFGIGKVAIIYSVLFYFVKTIDPKEILLKPDVKEKSFFYSRIEPIFPEGKNYFLD